VEIICFNSKDTPRAGTFTLAIIETEDGSET